MEHNPNISEQLTHSDSKAAVSKVEKYIITVEHWTLLLLICRATGSLHAC
jgi:hypothetical protein